MPDIQVWLHNICHCSDWSRCVMCILLPDTYIDDGLEFPMPAEPITLSAELWCDLLSGVRFSGRSARGFYEVY